MANTHGVPDIIREIQSRTGDVGRGWVVSGGLHATAAGMVSAAVATQAYLPTGEYVNQSAVAINYTSVGAPTTGTSWVIVHKDITGNIGAFVRVLGTHYLVNVSSGATQPALPSSSAWLMQVTTTASVITAVRDLRRTWEAAHVGATNVLNPRYGVVGDGVTDDAAALNALLTTVDAAGGGVVYFPAGTYLLSTSLLVPSNTRIYGDGPATVIKMGAAQTTDAFRNTGYGGTYNANINITIENLAINGNRLTPAGAFSTYESNVWAASTAYPVGRYVVHFSTYYRVYRCTTSGTSAGSGGPSGTGGAITDGSCVWAFVEELFTENTIPGGHQAAVSLWGVTNCTVRNLHVYMSRDNGMIFSLCYNAKVLGNDLRDINKNCIYFSDNEHSACANNTCSLSYNGIALACEWYSSVTGNVGRHLLNYFIGVGRDAQYCTITGNSGGTSLSGSSGLASGGDFRVTLESITGTTHGKTYALPYDDYRYGIYHSVIAGNVFTIMQFEMSDGNIISGNVIHNARRDGLHLFGSNQNLICFNKVYNGGSPTLGPWALGNLRQTSAGALQTNIDSVQNRWLYNEVHDDRANDGTVRWGMTFTGSPSQLQVIGNVVYLDDSVSIVARFYNWNVDYGVFKDNYYGNGSGYLKFLPAGSLPTAREELRGDFWTVPGAAGVRDTMYMCQKDTADAYGWEGIPDKATVLIGTATWDMSSTADGGTNSTVVTVTGVVSTDIIIASYDAIANIGNVFISANYQSANTVRVQVYNRTGGAIDPGSGTVSVIAFRLT